MDSGAPYSTQLNADPRRSSSLKTLLWGTQATDSCPEALGIAYQTLPEVVSGLQACKYRPERALASRRAEGRGQADAPPWKPCQQVSVLCERKSPAPCRPTSSSPALSLGWRWAVSRFSGGWGGGGVCVTNTAKGPGGHVHSRASVSPERGTPAQGAPQPDGASPPPQVRRHHLLLLLLAHSCTFHRSRRGLARCSYPRRPRATSAYVSVGACALARPRPLAGLRPLAEGARSRLAQAPSAPGRWTGADEVGQRCREWATTRAKRRVRAVSACRVEWSHLPKRAPRACAAPQVAGPGPPVPVGAHAGGAFPSSGRALEFEEAQWRTLNPSIDTVGVPSAWSKWDGVKSQYLSLLLCFTCFPGKVNPSNAWVASDVIIQLVATASPVLFMNVWTVPLTAQNVNPTALPAPKLNIYPTVRAASTITEMQWCTNRDGIGDELIWG